MTSTVNCHSSALNNQVQRIRTEGLALEEDGQGHTRQLSAPIYDDAGHITAALTLTAAQGAIPPELSEALKNTAQRLSGQLGWIEQA